MPEPTFVGFRVFFFSFLGRIVSELGFVLSVPFVPSFEPAGAKDTCGTDATVSVSTVMWCTEPSECFALLVLPEVLDWREGIDGGTLVIAGLLSALILPLSLPLSLLDAALGGLCNLCDDRSRRSICDPVSETALSCILSIMLGRPCGEAMGLTSSTVSRVIALPLAPRAVGRIPGSRWDSSASVSL